MAPLSLVLSGHAAYGAFGPGAALSASCSLGQTLASSWRGRRLDRDGSARILHRELLLCAAAFAGCGAELTLHLPLSLTLLSVFVAGGLASALPGGYIALLPTILRPAELARAHTANAVALELNWVVSPLAVSLVALIEPPVASLAVISAGLIAAERTLHRLTQATWSAPSATSPAVGPDAEPHPGRLVPPTVLAIYLLAFATSAGCALVEVAMPAFLAFHHQAAALSGVVIGVQGMASVIAGTVVLRRGTSTPTTHRRLLLRRAVLLCIALGLGLLVLGRLSPSVWFVLVLAGTGLTLAPMNALWGQLLQRVLGAGQRAEGYSVLYGCVRLGSVVGAGTTTVVLVRGSAPDALALAWLPPIATGAALLAFPKLRRAQAPTR